ncbi:MAG TPA: J domain-containing protein [Candidatus Binatia bacterium]|nr:J domain-containing protein [Candidatus Binatia bacterium]
MAEREDLYRILQVDPGASPLVIQAAYRVLARIFHPDVEGDDAQMKRINHAWAVLGDPRRRAAYDAERAGRHPGPAAGAPDRPATAPVRPAPSTTAAAPGVAGQRHGTEDHAGPPPGHPSGPVMRFGRYEGWSLGEIARVDRPFLEWLRRVPAGRQLREDIDLALRTAGSSTTLASRRATTTGDGRVHTWTSIRRPGART